MKPQSACDLIRAEELNKACEEELAPPLAEVASDHQLTITPHGATGGWVGACFCGWKSHIYNDDTACGGEWLDHLAEADPQATRRAYRHHPKP